MGINGIKMIYFFSFNYVPYAHYTNPIYGAVIEALKLPKEGGKGLAIIQNEQVRRKLKPSLGNYSEESVSTDIFRVKNWQPRFCQTQTQSKPKQ